MKAKVGTVDRRPDTPAAKAERDAIVRRILAESGTVDAYDVAMFNSSI